MDAAPRLHLQGVVLPQGEACDLWLVDGVVRTLCNVDQLDGATPADLLAEGAGEPFEGALGHPLAAVRQLLAG